MLSDLTHLCPGSSSSPGGRDQKADPGPVRRSDPVKRRPVLPALTLPEWFLVDDPGTGFALAALHDPAPGHQFRDDLVASHGVLRGGGQIITELMARIGVVQRRQREAGSWVIDEEPLGEGEGWQDWPAFHRVATTDRA